MAIDTVSVTAAPPAPKAPPVQAFNHEDGPSFSDVLDILNPLQHIPIINTIYRHLTGDTEGAVADVAGGTLWAGPIGLVGSLIDLSVKADTGKSIGDTVLAWLGLDDDDGEVAVAENQQQSQPAPAAEQAAQQQVVASAAPAMAPIPLTPAAKVKKDEERTDKDGPQQKGEYLVFGGGGQPAAIAPAAAPSPVQAAAAYAAPQQKGQYLVFGGPAAPIAPAPQAPVTLASAAPAPAPTPASVPATPAGLSPLPARNFAVPARRTQVAPTALPPPTTGPAAIPGHGPSQAIAGNGDADWFLGAVASNLDKYQAAQKLSRSNTDNSDSATLH